MSSAFQFYFFMNWIRIHCTVSIICLQNLLTRVIPCDWVWTWLPWKETKPKCWNINDIVPKHADVHWGALIVVGRCYLICYLVHVVSMFSLPIIAAPKSYEISTVLRTPPPHLMRLDHRRKTLAFLDSPLVNWGTFWLTFPLYNFKCFRGMWNRNARTICNQNHATKIQKF